LDLSDEDNSSHETKEETQERHRLFWQASNQKIANSLVIVQQATEFLLKAKIGAVSPYLLIANDPRDWPKGSKTDNTIDFSHFRTLDAIHLPKICDAVSQNRLPVDFHEHYGELREQRNNVIHLTGRSAIQGQEVYKIILKSFKYLAPPECQPWFQEREKYSQSDENSVLGFDDTRWALVREALQVIEYLKPADCLDLLGFDKRKRRYRCPSCEGELHHYSDGKVDLCQFPQSTPKQTMIRCFRCGESFDVERRKCPSPSCQGDVIWKDELWCMSCGEQVPEI
jgi:hypothetical protein